MSTTLQWPHVYAHPELANEITYICNDAMKTLANDDRYRLLFSQRFAIANALLAAGWRPSADEALELASNTTTPRRSGAFVTYLQITWHRLALRHWQEPRVNGDTPARVLCGCGVVWEDGST